MSATTTAKQKFSAKKPQQVNCRYCNTQMQPEKYYNCHCGYEMCWDCFDDLYEDKEPYCPACDAYLVSDSEDEQQSSSRKYSDERVASKRAFQGNASLLSGTSASTVIQSPNSDLAKVRVIKKNLVYVIGLSPDIAHEDILTKKEYFSQYGKITKIVVNTSNAYNPKGPNGPSYSAYITYSNEREASMAILATEEYEINERVIKASYGTTKYCSFFLKAQECPNLPDCLYLHSYGKDKEFFSKEDTANKHVFLDQQKMAIKNIQKFIPDLIKIKATPQPFVSVLPSPISVIDRLLETEAIEFKSADKTPTVETTTKQQTPPKAQQPVDMKKKKVEDNTPLVDQWSLDLAPIVKAKPAPAKKAAVQPTNLVSTSSANSSNSEKKSTDQSNVKAKEQTNEQQSQLQPDISQGVAVSNQNGKGGLLPSVSSQTATASTQLPTNKDSKAQIGMNLTSTMSAPLGTTTSTTKVGETKANGNSNRQVQSTTTAAAVVQSVTSEIQSKVVGQTKLSSTNSQSNAEKSPPQKDQNQNINSNNQGWIGIDSVNGNSKKKPSQQTVPTPVISAATSQSVSMNSTTTTINTTTSNAPPPLLLGTVNAQQQISNASTNQSVSITKSASTGMSTVQATPNSNIKQNGPTTNSNTGAIIYEKKEAQKKEQNEGKPQKHQYIPVSQAAKILQAQQQQQQLQQQQQQQQQAQQQQQQPTQQQPVQQVGTESGNIKNTMSEDIAQSNNLLPPVPKYKLEKIQKTEKIESSDSKIMKRLIVKASQSNCSRFLFARSEESSVSQSPSYESSDLLDHLFDGKYMNLIKPQSIRKSTGNSNTSKGSAH